MLKKKSVPHKLSSTNCNFHPQESGVLPITLLTKTFSVVNGNGKKVTVTRQQLPITPAYAFTDYHSQAHTIDHCIVDLAKPPSGQLTPFNAYVTLLWSRGRSSIRLLQDFDEGLFTQHPNEHLWKEDDRLAELDWQMKKEWDVFQRTREVSWREIVEEVKVRSSHSVHNNAE